MQPGSILRPGATPKLFLALLAMSIAIIVAMSIAAQVSFDRGFLGYLNERGVDRIEQLAPVLAARYKEDGSWALLCCHGPRGWLQLVHLPSASEDDSLLTGLDRRITLLDRDRRHIIGNPTVGAGAIMRPIVSDGHTVGWLALVPFERVTTAAEIRLRDRQLKASWGIGAISALLAALLAIWLTRLLLSPLRRIAAGTRRLAAGDYSFRLAVFTPDEIGRLCQDFNGLAHALERNQHLRRAYMADVSHELRTPLAVLRGELEALQDGVRDVSPRSLESLRSEVSTLSKLVDDLYDLSLSDAGALTYRLAQVDPAELLQATIDAFTARLTYQGIALEAEIQRRALTLMGDETRLRQLFRNLMENAVRYTDRDGRLRIGARRHGRWVQIDFQDSAPGVSAELIPRLFERFYRVDGSRNRASGGAGLGLAISKNIVEAHGGTITARPSPLGGLWIAVVLPCIERSAP